MVQPADELVSPYPTHAASTYRAVQVSFATHVEVTIAQRAAITPKRIRSNIGGSYQDNGNNDRDFVQHSVFHVVAFSVGGERSNDHYASCSISDVQNWNFAKILSQDGLEPLNIGANITTHRPIADKFMVRIISFGCRMGF
jgi:hypothetical protein